MRFRRMIGVAAIAGVASLAPCLAYTQTLTPTPTPTPPAVPSPAPTPSPTPPIPIQTPALSPPTLPISRQLEGGFFRNLLQDQKAIWTSPAHMGTGDIWWVGSLAGASSALFATDVRTGDEIAEHPELMAPSVAISYAGSGYTVAGAAASFYVIGRATHNNRAMETGLLGTEAFLNSAIVVLAVKGVTQRARPEEGEERGEFFAGGTSFPSGHASNIWSFATVVASEYHDKPIVPIAAYSVAGLVSVARFTAQRHYMSDVLIGSAVGFGIGRYVYRTHHADLSHSVSAADARGGTGKWPLISPEINRRSNAYRVRLTWNY